MQFELMLPNQFYSHINNITQKNMLGEGNLIFCCTGPTDLNFWQVK